MINDLIYYLKKKIIRETQRNVQKQQIAYYSLLLMLKSKVSLALVVICFTSKDVVFTLDSSKQ